MVMFGENFHLITPKTVFVSYRNIRNSLIEKSASRNFNPHRASRTESNDFFDISCVNFKMKMEFWSETLDLNSVVPQFDIYDDENNSLDDPSVPKVTQPVDIRGEVEL